MDETYEARRNEEEARSRARLLEKRVRANEGEKRIGRYMRLTNPLLSETGHSERGAGKSSHTQNSVRFSSSKLV
eukprot:763360-Hanusia_phi.AAC.9